MFIMREIVKATVSLLQLAVDVIDVILSENNIAILGTFFENSCSSLSFLTAHFLNSDPVNPLVCFNIV